MHEYIFHKTIATISLIGKTLRSIYAQRNHSGHLSMRGPMLLTKWSCWKKITRLSNEVCIIERKDSAARICERYFLFCHSPSVDIAFAICPTRGAFCSSSFLDILMGAATLTLRTYLSPTSRRVYPLSSCLDNTLSSQAVGLEVLPRHFPWFSNPCHLRAWPAPQSCRGSIPCKV